MTTTNVLATKEAVKALEGMAFNPVKIWRRLVTPTRKIISVQVNVKSGKNTVIQALIRTIRKTLL